MTTEREIEILNGAPPAIRRPLSLIEGQGYLVTWLYAQMTIHELDGKKLRRPIVRNQYVQYVLCENGLGWDEETVESGLEINVHLREMPPTDKLMSGKAVKKYQNGDRPSPADVFDRVVEVVDCFSDFSRSLADQRTMAELAGCYILATWFLDAFTVIGFLWPNGDRGCGKTQLLTVVAELAYLGMVVLAGGSYASLRDMADYGACLAFDDAENMSGPKTDPDKRALLLAGNRKGNVVPVKELDRDKNWRTRYVNTYCARLFSAINLPDPVLESRSIVIPLIRTADRKKANRDPADYTSWPHNRRELIDDLWALGLSRLKELPRYEAMASKEARLSGRNLEPWKAILAVAKWLDDNGLSGLWERMERLSWDYQKERQDLMTTDLTILVIKALCR